MKLYFIIPLLLVIIPAFGQLSDQTGLVKKIDIQTSGHTFEIETVSNFDITDYEFDKDKKLLTLYISSSLKNNLGEIIMPINLLSGNFTFYLNEEEYFAKTSSNKDISFITLNFTGSGYNKLEIFGTTYLDGLNVDRQEYVSTLQNETISSLGWWILGAVLIATATFIILKIKKQKHG